MEPHTLTIEEVKGLHYGQILHHQHERYAEGSAKTWGDYNPGRCRNYRVTGQVKRWKRDQDRVSVPVKYGMYGPNNRIETELDRAFYALEGHCPKCARVVAAMRAEEEVLSGS